MCRVAGSSILFWILFLIKPSKPGINRKDILLFILCALLGVALNQALFVKGLSLTSAIHASLLMLVTPILIIFIAAWLLKEKITFLKITGVIAGISGSGILILMKDASHTATNIILGDVLIILNAVGLCILPCNCKTPDVAIYCHPRSKMGFYFRPVVYDTLWMA